MFVLGENAKNLKRITKIANNILSLEASFKKLTDSELKNKTSEFKKRYKEGESLNSLLEETFAVCREAANRVIGLNHYKEQIMGGIILHEGRISEIKTGEGKTLTATLPVYLNSISGCGVHVITPNEYLAKRDNDLMNRLYSFLGLTNSVILMSMTSEEKRNAYNSDITYGTCSEFGFDYLRDNMTYNKEHRVQRGLEYVLLDEIDAILLDEARCPLIITKVDNNISYLYEVANDFVRLLTDKDYKIDRKEKSIYLTAIGIEKVEKLFNINIYSDVKHIELHHHIKQALKANYIMIKDKDYIVKDNDIFIVSESTGRALQGRRYNDGLHQAIEQKEGVTIKGESRTIASITYQNFFRKYKKLSGMSGTAYSNEKEFKEIYNIDVVKVPTHRPIKRNDMRDKIFTNRKHKYDSIILEVKKSIAKEQPILIGATNIDQTEYLDKLLKEHGIYNQNILNARNDEVESKLISKAGQKGMITIATNMAGRGTDIKLGEGVEEIGGLKIIGTEKNPSIRVDDQLRGRAGRQGEAGETIFFVSLEDEIMNNVDIKKYKEKFNNYNGDLSGISDKLNNTVFNLIKKSQRISENSDFESRKEMLAYDDVINKQADIIYNDRNTILEAITLECVISGLIEDVVYELVNLQLKNKKITADKLNLLMLEINRLSNQKNDYIETFTGNFIDELKRYIAITLQENYKSKVEAIEDIQFIEVQRNLLLNIIDKNWSEYLESMSILKRDIQLRVFKQVEPKELYKIEASKSFEQLNNRIKIEIVQSLFYLERT